MHSVVLAIEKESSNIFEASEKDLFIPKKKNQIPKNQ